MSGLSLQTSWRSRWMTRWGGLPANARAAAWILLGAAGFTVMASLVKVLGENLDSFQILFFRTVVGLVILTPLALRAGLASVVYTRVPLLHGARACAGFAAMLCGFYALTQLPLATVTAVTFTKPLFVVVLAWLFLAESVGWRRWAATAVGFVGVLVMLRPGQGAFDLAMLVAIGQALAIAIAVLLVKTFPVEERHLTILFHFALLSTLLSLGPAIAVWQDPTWREVGLAIAMGALGVASQAAVIHGYRMGEASALAPFDYARLIFATVIGFVVFMEVPDVWSILGAAIIVVSTVYIGHREANAAAPPPPGAASS